MLKNVIEYLYITYLLPLKIYDPVGSKLGLRSEDHGFESRPILHTR